MIVAPKMPGTELICGPTGLTTISRLPSTLSMRTAARWSPARTSSSGSCVSCSRRDTGTASNWARSCIENSSPA